MHKRPFPHFDAGKLSQSEVLPDHVLHVSGSTFAIITELLQLLYLPSRWFGSDGDIERLRKRAIKELAVPVHFDDLLSELTLLRQAVQDKNFVINMPSCAPPNLQCEYDFPPINEPPAGWVNYPPDLGNPSDSEAYSLKCGKVRVMIDVLFRQAYKMRLWVQESSRTLESLQLIWSFVDDVGPPQWAWPVTAWAIFYDLSTLLLSWFTIPLSNSLVAYLVSIEQELFDAGMDSQDGNEIRGSWRLILNGSSGIIRQILQLMLQVTPVELVFDSSYVAPQSYVDQCIEPNNNTVGWSNEPGLIPHARVVSHPAGWLGGAEWRVDDNGLAVPDGQWTFGHTAETNQSRAINIAWSQPKTVTCTAYRPSPASGAQRSIAKYANGNVVNWSPSQLADDMAGNTLVGINQIIIWCQADEYIPGSFEVDFTIQ